MSKGKWLKVGAMLKKKEGEGFYIKIEHDLKAGTILQCEKPKDRIERLVEKGIITQEEGDERLNKVPDFVKLELILPPPKDDKF